MLEDMASMRAEIAALRAEMAEMKQSSQAHVDPCADQSPVFLGQVTAYTYKGCNRNMAKNTTTSTERCMTGSAFFLKQNVKTGMFEMGLDEDDAARNADYFICAFTSDTPHTAVCSSTYEEPNVPQGPGSAVVHFHNVSVHSPGAPCTAQNLTILGMYNYDIQVDDSGVYTFFA
jgi:hypothetical protein